MWRTATEAALRERKFGMAIDAGLLLIRALNRAIGETADSTTVANIYARAREHFAASVADPNAPPLTEGIVNVYRETLDPGDGLTAAGR